MYTEVSLKLTQVIDPQKGSDQDISQEKHGEGWQTKSGAKSQMRLIAIIILM